MESNPDLVLLRLTIDAIDHRKRRRCRYVLHSERLGDLEAALDFVIGEIIAEAVVVRVKLDSGGVEFPPNIADFIERNRQTPFAHVFAGRVRPDVALEQFTFAQPDFLHPFDAFIQGTVTKAVRLRADLHAMHLRIHAPRKGGRGWERGQRQFRKFPS